MTENAVPTEQLLSFSKCSLLPPYPGPILKYYKLFVLVAPITLFSNNILWYYRY